MTISKNKCIPIIVIMSVLLIGAFFHHPKGSNEFHCDSKKFSYVNSVLGCLNGFDFEVSKQPYTTEKVKILEYISKVKKEGKATDVSIYFRDLVVGPTLGIDEHRLFSPASLLKLPVLMSYYNLKEKIPELFERKMKVEPVDDDLVQLISPEETAADGGEYTVGNLINMMIINSDNASFYNLVDYLYQLSPKEDIHKNTLIDLGLINPDDPFEETVSVKLYGSIFVQLFNSSYYSDPEISSAILELLTKTTWSKGLRAGVPNNILVANKFGERINFDTDVVQLHDCGIIYYPNNPYLLCVMTRGDDEDELTTIISDISEIFYDSINSRKK